MTWSCPATGNQPDATAEALRGGWLHTGDVGSFDADGYLTLRDRSKDLIISGGMNIYPREVEEALLRHPGVRAVSVVGRPDVRSGARRWWPSWWPPTVPHPAAGRGPRPDVPRSHRQVQTAQGLPVRRRSADQQLRQGPQAGPTRPAPSRGGRRRIVLNSRVPPAAGPLQAVELMTLLCPESSGTAVRSPVRVDHLGRSRGSGGMPLDLKRWPLQATNTQ